MPYLFQVSTSTDRDRDTVITKRAVEFHLLEIQRKRRCSCDDLAQLLLYKLQVGRRKSNEGDYSDVCGRIKASISIAKTVKKVIVSVLL
jgi:hypothetical protein